MLFEAIQQSRPEITINHNASAASPETATAIPLNAQRIADTMMIDAAHASVLSRSDCKRELGDPAELPKHFWCDCLNMLAP
jgi:hypothetical protein